jgi:hypothetical protein
VIPCAMAIPKTGSAAPLGAVLARFWRLGAPGGGRPRPAGDGRARGGRSRGCPAAGKSRRAAGLADSLRGRKMIVKGRSRLLGTADCSARCPGPQPFPPALTPKAAAEAPQASEAQGAFLSSSDWNGGPLRALFGSADSDPPPPTGFAAGPRHYKTGAFFRGRNSGRGLLGGPRPWELVSANCVSSSPSITSFQSVPDTSGILISTLTRCATRAASA